MVAYCLIAIFAVLSAVHWYWVLGGEFGVSSAVPEIEAKPAFVPGPLATSLVAAALLAAAILCAKQAEIAGLQRSMLSRVGVGALSGIFVIRAIGDFRLVGFFKRVKGSKFASLDSLVYSPLCMLISALCGLLLYKSVR